VPALGSVERARERALAHAARARVAEPQRLQRAVPRRCGVREREPRERVPLTDVAVEVRQRRDPPGIIGGVVHDHREPEAQLTEPDRGGIHVHAEDRVREHVPPPRREAARISGARPTLGERLERVHEERAGAAGGVE
jgi:hypothetical protein